MQKKVKKYQVPNANSHSQPPPQLQVVNAKKLFKKVQVIALHILNAEKKLKSTKYQMPTPTSQSQPPPT